MSEKKEEYVRCKGANCGAKVGEKHSRECIIEAAATQGWVPTEADFEQAGWDERSDKGEEQ